MKQITQLFLEGQSPTLSKANRVTVTLSCLITEKFVLKPISRQFDIFVGCI